MLYTVFSVFYLATSAHAGMDLSDLSFHADTFSTSTYVQLLLSDPYGRQTSLQATQIPNSNYTLDSADDDETGTPATEVADVGVGPVSAGRYDLAAIGIATSAYEIEIRAAHADASTSNLLVQGFLQAGTTAAYTIDYDPTPGANFVVTKTLYFPILRQELQAAYQLGDIGGKKFVDELDDVLAQGEKALARMNRDHDKHNDAGDNDGKREAVAKLREFAKRIESAAKVKPGDHGHDRGRDDDERRFATATAAQSLTADADALIVQLGGKVSPGNNDHGGTRENEGRQ